MLLPLFLARRLWRSWRAVQSATVGPRLHGPPVPAMTVSRWRARLASDARMILQVLATSGDQVLAGVTREVGLCVDRLAALRAYQATTKTVGLAPLAEHLHRLMPGVRLM
jgi:hypothetical protein